MNSRQRVLAAVNHQPVDRPPIDLGAMRASGISAVLYHKIKQRLGINTPTKIHDSMQILAELEPEIIEHFHIDVLPLEAATATWADADAETGVERTLFDGTTVYFPPGTNIREESDGAWVHCDATDVAFARMPKNGYYFDFIRQLEPDQTIDPDAFQPRATVPDEELELLAARASHLYENTDKAILGWGTCLSLMGLSWLLGDNITQGALDEWLVMLMTEKETANEMMGRYVDSVVSCLGLYHQAVGDKAFAWGIASDDAGTQRAPLLKPDLFVEMIKPHYERLCDWVHTNTGWKTYLHSCGSIYDYIPEWIEAGVDILNPVQISAANMTPERLKAEFGDDLVFWGGGCDTQQVLPLGTPEQVREHVRHNIEVFNRHGGYVFTQVHNIQQTVPPENVEAMFEAAYECA
jgi:uroporphyrinogen-III decarboxylase